MNNTSAANTSLENATNSSMVIGSKAEGIAWCTVLILASLFIVVGNLLAIVLFARNKTLRKKSLFLVINMAFADLMVGALSLPLYIYIYIGGYNYQLWETSENKPLNVFFVIADNVSMIATLISAASISGERFYAIFWPFKHRTLSMRAYRIVIFMVWTLALFDTGLAFLPISNKLYHITWASFGFTLTFIICGCNIGIWRKFQDGPVAIQQENRASQNKRLTKTLMFVSVLALLSWLPLITLDALFYFFYFSVPNRYVLVASILNYSNSFVNPVVYALRIPEFKQALALCSLRRKEEMNGGGDERRNNAATAVTPATPLRTLRTDPSHIGLAFEQQNMETKL